MEEVWKSVIGYVGLYEVSNHGNVRSLKRATTSGKMIKPYVNTRNNYVYVCLSKNNIKKQYRVHRLVMTAFSQEHRGMQINHIDGNKQNNNLNNLEWCTQSENMKHAYRTGLEHKNGKRVIDLTTGSIYESSTDAAKSVGGEKANSVIRVCNGKRSQYRNHSFAYYDDYVSGTIPEFKGRYTRKSSESLWEK